ncbi:MAG: 7-cyano-7-deazaguanine synthase [Panacibacter sp.]
MKSCVLLFSGGIDSSNTLVMLLKENFTVFPLYIDYGQKSLKNELKAVKYFVRKFKINPLKIVKTNTYKNIFNHPLLSLNEQLEIPTLNATTSKNFLHFRNLTFACIAAIYSREVKAQNIAFGFIKKDSFKSFPDTSPDFVMKLNDLLEIIEPNFPIKIVSPGITFSKAEIIEYGIENKIPLAKTYSCYEGERCFKCESCLEVMNAFDVLSSKVNIRIINKLNPYKTSFQKHGTR